MLPEPTQYRGYIILPTPQRERNGEYSGGYAILKAGTVVRIRERVFPARLYLRAAIAESVQHAKLEIDFLMM
ncbi:hypothetical protein E4K72_03985 [Oxalobacteraceae bacterium OM1]|nr:hypothetical protein E4K72_03985 [Oxalobacteraceae bacterium OM1]